MAIHLSKSGWPVAKKSAASTISASVARFWGTQCVFSGIFEEKEIFVDFYDVIWVTDGRLSRGVGGALNERQYHATTRIGKS